FLFLQAEDGIRDRNVTGVQTCALPICYHDYGTFTPIQVAAIAALEGPQDCVAEITASYKNRRDVLAKGLQEIGWNVDIPKASMRSEERRVGKEGRSRWGRGA